MILSKRVRLSGAYLDELSEYIVIRGVDPGTPQDDAQTADKWGGYGSRLLGSHRGPLKATVTFAIDVDKRHMSTRNNIYDQVVAWANKKGWMYFMHLNKGRRMYVERVVLPSREDLWDWTRDYTIEFWNYSVPFWETASGSTAITNKKITSGVAGTIEVDGTADSVVEVTFKNASGKTINDFSITAGNSSMSLAGVKLTSDETLVIDHKLDGTLRARAGVLNSSGSLTSTRSVYGLITGDDDLIVSPGKAKITVDASRAGYLTIQNYARWL